MPRERPASGTAQVRVGSPRRRPPRGLELERRTRSRAFDTVAGLDDAAATSRACASLNRTASPLSRSADPRWRPDPALCELGAGTRRTRSTLVEERRRRATRRRDRAEPRRATPRDGSPRPIAGRIALASAARQQLGEQSRRRRVRATFGRARRVTSAVGHRASQRARPRRRVRVERQAPHERRPGAG